MNEGKPEKTLTPEYFENVYNNSDDPWDFATSDYEAAKYAATIAALPKEKYESAFEIGCSIGVLTSKLAERCERLLSVDVNDSALAKARERNRDLSSVKIKKMFVPDEFPSEKFDLIVVSEVGYYLSIEDWKKLSDKIFDKLKTNGDVILIHWTHFVEDYPQTGDEVHESFERYAAEKLTRIKAERTADYRLDVWRKADKF